MTTNHVSESLLPSLTRHGHASSVSAHATAFTGPYTQSGVTHFAVKGPVVFYIASPHPTPFPFHLHVRLPLRSKFSLFITQGTKRSPNTALCSVPAAFGRSMRSSPPSELSTPFEVTLKPTPGLQKTALLKQTGRAPWPRRLRGLFQLGGLMKCVTAEAGFPSGGCSQ